MSVIEMFLVWLFNMLPSILVDLSEWKGQLFRLPKTQQSTESTLGFAEPLSELSDSKIYECGDKM